MIHSRPGFQPRVTREGAKHEPRPSRVQPDMQPAIMKHTTATTATKPALMQNEQAGLPVERMQAQAEAALKRMQDAAAETARRAGPEILVNPAPSATPVITSPHVE
jgi:hypothetical protein